MSSTDDIKHPDELPRKQTETLQLLLIGVGAFAVIVGAAWMLTGQL